MRNTPIFIVFLIVLAGGAYLLWGGAAPQEPTPSLAENASGTSSVGKGAEVDMPVAKEAATPSPADQVTEKPLPGKQEPGPESLKMPDGTYLPVLNGAVGAPAVEWPKGTPYSPVIKKIVDKEGLEWYVHKDGSFTITQNLYRSDLGRIEPATTIYNPEESHAMDPGEADKAQKEMEGAQKGKQGKGR